MSVTTFTELRAHIPMATPKGTGRAIAVIDYGPHENLHWIVVLDATGQIWTCPNPEVRVLENWTLRQGSEPVERR